MIVSIALGLTAFSTLVGAYSVLTREITRNYMESRPASIILEMDDVDDATLSWMRQRPDIEAATRRARLSARFSTDGSSDKRRAHVFVVDDFRHMEMAKIFPERGAWPPTPGTALMERSAVEVLGAEVGATLQLEFPGRPPAAVRVSGLAHEPALAPANTEQAVYLYMTRAELARWGHPVDFDELRVIPRGASDIDSLEHKARQLASELRASGHGPVTALRVPPPGQHPHQTQMTTVLGLFVIFAGLVVVLSSLLSASLLSTMMARQVREMGILKTLGASRAQLLCSFALLVEVIAVLAWGASLFPAEAGARSFVRSITHLLNFDVVDAAQSTEARILQVGVALFVPLLVAFPALLRGSGVPVMQALSDFGVRAESFGRSRLERWAATWGGGGQWFAYALRSAMRRRGRFFLSLALLSTAGAIFLSAMNTARSWEVVTERLYTSRSYDLEVGFAGHAPAEALAKALRTEPEIGRVEVWRSMRIAPSAGEELPGSSAPIQTAPTDPLRWLLLRSARKW